MGSSGGEVGCASDDSGEQGRVSAPRCAPLGALTRPRSPESPDAHYMGSATHSQSPYQVTVTATDGSNSVSQSDGEAFQMVEETLPLFVDGRVLLIGADDVLALAP